MYLQVLQFYIEKTFFRLGKTILILNVKLFPPNESNLVDVNPHLVCALGRQELSSGL